MWFACAFTVCMQVSMPVCLGCCFHSAPWLRIPFLLWFGVWWYELTNNLFNFLLTLKNMVRSNSVLCMCDTVAGLSWSENVLTNMCLSAHHLITQGCIICACLNIWKTDVSTLSSHDQVRKKKMMHAEIATHILWPCEPYKLQQRVSGPLPTNWMTRNSNELLCTSTGLNCVSVWNQTTATTGETSIIS